MWTESTQSLQPTAAEAAMAEAVEVYHRTYSTVLQSTGETRLRVLEPSHKAMGSSLHPLANSAELDLGAFLYACRRVPDRVMTTQLIVMGQSREVFGREGYHLNDGRWDELRAPGRRRRWYDNGTGTMAVLIASSSDVDDLVPTLVAMQIEWNKLHARLGDVSQMLEDAVSAQELARMLGGREGDWEQLKELWDSSFAERLTSIGKGKLSLRIRMLGGTQIGYARVTRQWWHDIADVMAARDVADRPVYFVSSNSHSVVNLIAGITPARERDLIALVESGGPADLQEELQRLQNGNSEGNWDNFLYYANRIYAVPAISPLPAVEDRAPGVVRIRSQTGIDVSAQVIVLDHCNPDTFDERLRPVDVERLRSSQAVIVNIDYPLGLAAYNILREVAQSVGELRGVYVLGKAATLNADVGDVMISNVIHDEHSASTYWLDNVFSVADIAPYLRFGSGLDNQRAVTVLGTFLQNRGSLDFYYREAFTVVEMEAGPYCSAIYEMTEANRYPTGQPVNFSHLPIDFGVIHYASDTPYTQARTLGARGLSYHGMDSTYASSVAILRRILRREGLLRESNADAQSVPGEDSIRVNV